MSAAWPGLEHVFSYDGDAHSRAAFSSSDTRPPRKLLRERPVDLLVVDLGARQPGRARFRESWLDLVQEATERPLVIMESWPPEAASWENHPMSKGMAQPWADLGYSSRFRLVSSLWVGGAVTQSRLLVARVRTDLTDSFEWPTLACPEHPRPMGNLLTPHGLLPRAVKRQTSNNDPYEGPDSSTDPMPSEVGSWITTPHGSRRLQADELARGLGVPKDKLSGSLRAHLLRHTTSVFIWEYVSRALQPSNLPDRASPQLYQLHSSPTPEGILGPSLQANPTAPDADFTWRPPDLSPGGEWHNARLANLARACAHYPDQSLRLYEDGIHLLEIHRNNYTEEGADVQQLQLLWWEFPREHWDELREGCDMGFLTPPERVLHPNSPMDEEQTQVAGQFVEELMDIGVLRPLLEGEEIWTNAPLFCVPKPGQEGEWRVIADCKAGGQNAFIGGDPVYLNRPLHILEQMYSGGFSAVVDASKFFYQFPVRMEDQKYFGVIHPVTGQHLLYTGLPMGSGSSPGLAGRFGLAFVRMLKETCGVFERSARVNGWWSQLTDEGYNPTLGYGFSLHSQDGSPAVKIWVHVDDFLIHGPTLASTLEALRFFMDKALDVGMLCHPKKLKPPSQLQRYCGFEFDTRSDPVLHIPADKHERCCAMVDYLGAFSPGAKISRLALSVIAGTLESVSDATPNRLGHTYLRATHSLIHPDGHEPGRQLYYTYARVTDEVLREMRWWKEILRVGRGRQLRSSRSATLVPSWGDGSGTGTGGTVDIPGQGFKLWMGQWSPTVYKESSNWKELKTLLLTLQYLAALPGDHLRGVTLFYFTDNSPTYFVIASGSSTSPGLHALVEQVQLLTLQMGCFLQVVHVPGLVMIDQGTDGLSRGIWVSSFHIPVDHHTLNAAVFAPLYPDRALVETIIETHSLPREWTLHDYTHYGGSALFDHLSVVFPPPECARMCLIRLLEAWVERPFTTSALLFVPRVLSDFWLGLSRHLRVLEEIRPTYFPLARPPLLPIPFLVLYLPPHTRVLPAVDRRMVVPARVQNEREHVLHADYVRRLSSGAS